MKDARLCRQVLMALLASILAGLMGCRGTASRGNEPGLILFVPGVAGDGAWYRQIVPGLRACDDRRTVESVRWGAPGFAFFMNFNNVGIHDRAEKKLAQRILDYRRDHPGDPLDIIAHSAGGGVTLGALARLPANVRVGRVILLHPSVSPRYPLAAPLSACESITLFHSRLDTTFLQWRTSNFGTYDNIKTTAAGNCGFDLASLDPAQRARVTMVPFGEADRTLGNGGDHFGALTLDYLKLRVVPCLKRSTNDHAPARSAAANRR